MFNVYVLTRKDNQQDSGDDSEYFVELFAEQPTEKELSDCGVPTAYLNHVLNGGGKIGYESYWFFLRQKTLTTSEDKIYDRMKQSDSGT